MHSIIHPSLNNRPLRLTRIFFARSASIVARELLGMTIVRRFVDGRITAGTIIETEIYAGIRDAASHAYGGRRTRRTEPLFSGHAGSLYLYRVYGIYWQMNIIAGKAGCAESVCIRALAPVGCPDTLNKTNGPGKLCIWLGIDGDCAADDLVTSDRLWIEKGTANADTIIRKVRVGIDYAPAIWRNKKWRLLLAPYEKFLHR